MNSLIQKNEATMTYEGQFKNDLIDGQGVLRDESLGLVYKGGFVGGLKQGFGEERIFDAESKT